MVTNDHRSARDFAARFNTADLAIIAKEDLVNRFIQHVRSAVDRREPSERLGQPAQTVNWVDERGLAVFGNRVDVELHLVQRPESWFG